MFVSPVAKIKPIMTVKELQAILATMPQDAEVGIANSYLFPADIAKVELREVEGEQIVYIIEQ